MELKVGDTARHTLEANLNAGLAAARQICAFFKDGDTRFQLNR